MAYQEPKIDWKSTDYFNIQDYNRIVNNIKEIKSIAEQLYLPFSYDENGMGENKTYNSYIYADEVNAIEHNLALIVEHTYPFIIGDEKTYYDNQATPNYEEFNRIESAIKLIYESFKSQAEGRKRLSFILGGSEF